MKKKITLIFTALILLMAVAHSALAEGMYDFYYIFTPFFVDDTYTPWDANISQVEGYVKTLNGFQCTKIITNEMKCNINCLSQKGALDGQYKIVFQFNEYSYLDEMEVQFYHPRLTEYLSYGQNGLPYYASTCLRMLERRIEGASLSNTFYYDKYNHVFSDSSFTTEVCRDMNGSSIVCAGYREKSRPSEENMIIISFSKPEYYDSMQYTDVINPETNQFERKYYDKDSK